MYGVTNDKVSSISGSSSTSTTTTTKVASDSSSSTIFDKSKTKDDSSFDISSFDNIFDLMMQMPFNNPDVARPRISEHSSGELRRNVSGMKLPANCEQPLVEMCKSLGIKNVDDLKAVIYAESSGNPQAVNKDSGASGLIQFMPKTIEALNKRADVLEAYKGPVTMDRLRQMSAKDQIPLIKAYFEMAKKQAGFEDGRQLNAADVYALVFCPAKAKQENFYTRGSKAYALNSGCDLNKDGVITKAEMGARAGFFKIA